MNQEMSNEVPLTERPLHRDKCRNSKSISRNLIEFTKNNIVGKILTTPSPTFNSTMLTQRRAEPFDPYLGPFAITALDVKDALQSQKAFASSRLLSEYHADDDDDDDDDDDEDTTDAMLNAIQYLFQPRDPEPCESTATLPEHKYIHKFRTAVLVVQVIRNLIKIYRDYAASRSEPISFSEYVGFENETENLLFDRSLFKAKMEMVLCSDAKQILMSPPEKRTPEEAKLAMLSLRMTVSSFAAYPVQIQENIAKVGWYECFGPGRVIIRQGHVAQNFYLILSGTAVVTKVSRSKKTGEHFSKTVAFLKKGKYFGDVAILTNTKRNATVVCHDSVSLLAITRQDFLNIFLSSESHEGPDYIRMLESIDLLSGWPVHKLPYNNPRICVHTFYRAGTVITKDSKASSKIYVIKSGSVRVLKAMTTLKSQPLRNAYHLQSKYTFTKELRSKSSAQDREYEDPSYDFSEEEHLLPLLQRERKLDETVRSSAAATRQPVVSITQEDENVSQIFIHIQTLRAGEVFGLVYTIFEDTLGMALVSDGAECIVISKEFFKKQMTEDYIHKLSRQIQPYPTREMLQQKIQDHMKWQSYKSHLTRRR
ncbi:cyclic nucleotide-binding domain-containing protein 2-like [Leptodactylus fuscus]|uniref:cyclic nucleotide-binding domain-containing protein 2 n=1 Tax=Leptodactylus fuscus TaxID=238119 RepID=UPI003F4E5A6A